MAGQTSLSVGTQGGTGTVFCPAAPRPRTHGDDLPVGARLLGGQYVIDRYLNSGGFGITYLASDSLGRKVVIKECFPNAICGRTGDTVRLRSQSFEPEFTCAVELFQKEARALAALDHPNVVGVHQIFEANGTAYMALDFVEGLDLFDILDRHPEALGPAAIEELGLILLRALAYVHDRGILHRDISPDNILLDQMGTPVLIDFGSARQSATMQSRILSRVHTVKDGYSPQEFYLAGRGQSAASDLYALAATLVHVITGAAPPNSTMRLAAVAEGAPDPFQPLAGRCAGFSERFLTGIDRAMALFPKDRPQSAQDWLDAVADRPYGPRPRELDPDIQRRIAELVAMNRRVLAEDAERAAAETPAGDTAPDEEAARRAAEREYWAILNEDPADWVTDEAEASGDRPEGRAGVRPGLFSLARLMPWRPRQPDGTLAR